VIYLKRNTEQIVINTYQLIIIKYNEDLKEWVITKQEHLGSYKNKKDAINKALSVKRNLM
jgi:hypothetical protein